jgi:ubiquinol-cytochrome c reductase cytochrome b subunit
LLKTYLGQVWNLATPKNLSYYWGFGRFLGIIIVIQIISGVILAIYYVRGNLAWQSVIDISRDVFYGWVFRIVHSRAASFVFVIIFIHFFRGILNRSFFLKLPWLRGWVIMVLTIIAAFLGYVLPWGQMSFWGATVIINLLRVLPMGKTLVIWLWGGFYVSSFTCRFFYRIHYITPFLILVIVGIHLIFLHITGRSVPSGLRHCRALKLKFRFYFTMKDLVNFSLLWLLIIVMLAIPDFFSDPVNFVISDLTRSPLHIQPEWYFLHLYAILRSIPNKVGGLLGFAAALIGIALLALVYGYTRLSDFSSYLLISWSFISRNAILLWLGIQAVESPFILIGQIITAIYFFLLIKILVIDTVVTMLFK